jgi:hypothetical protein
MRMTPTARPTHRLCVAMLVAVIGAVSVALFFRYQILNGFTILMGDRYDQVIELSILQHWTNFLHGRAHWSETGYFYPVRDTLGYNDSYFMFGVIYSIFHAFGMDPYLSGELVNVVMRILAFITFYIAARRIFSLEIFWSLLGSVMFTLSNNLFVQSNHAQLFGVSFVPLEAILVKRFVTAVLRQRPFAIVGWGITAAGLYAAWLLTTFYMAWFFLFFGIFLLISYLCVTGWRSTLAFGKAVRSQLIPIGTVAAALVLLNLPFLMVYLPKARETGMHSFAEAKANTLSLLDLVNVGSQNILFGRTVEFLNHAVRPEFPGWSERMTGFPPVLLFFFLCGVICLYKARRRLDQARTALLVACALATAVTWALALHIRGFTPWWLVYSYFPGAKAARVVARYQIFLAAPVIIVALAYLQNRASRTSKPIIGLIGVLLIAEQLNAGPPLGLNRPQEVARLASVPAIPAGCEAFFVTRARPQVLYPAVDPIYSHNVDAMIIAETMNIPTLNGYSTFVPPHWHLVDPDNPDYLRRVRQFADLHHLSSGVCQLDLRSLQWTTHPFASR